MMKLTPEQKEAKGLLKGIEKSNVEAPSEEKDILKWSIPQLRAYVLKKTTGMNPTKKMKWARDLDKRIKEAKKLRDKK
jgi:hypothetical protein